MKISLGALPGLGVSAGAFCCTLGAALNPPLSAIQSMRTTGTRHRIRRLNISVSPRQAQNEYLSVLNIGPENQKIIVDGVIQIETRMVVDLDLCATQKTVISRVVDVVKPVLEVVSPVESAAF